MKDYAVSKNNVEIRLTHERWNHIKNSHSYLKGKRSRVLRTLEEPDFIVKGKKGELLATKLYKDKDTVVIYKEGENDGFVITAFVTSKVEKIKKNREIIWKKS